MHLPRKIVIGVGILVALPLLAVGAFLLLFDARQLRPLVQTQMQQRLDRPVSLGDMQLKAVPLSVRISDLVISQPEGFASPQPFLQAKEVKEVYVGVDLWPLLHKEVNIDAIRLRSPQLEIVRNPAGLWNYETGNGEPSAGGTSGSFTLDELSVEDGQVAIHDQKAGSARAVYEHIDLTLKGLGPNRRGSLAGTLRLDTMAAMLSIYSNFDNTEIFAPKALLRSSPIAIRMLWRLHMTFAAARLIRRLQSIL